MLHGHGLHRIGLTCSGASSLEPHNCLTYDAAYAIYYLDGNSVGSQPKNLSSGNSALVIGNGFDPARTDTFFHGLVDEVQLYNRALSTLEVRTLRNAGSAGTCRP